MAALGTGVIVVYGILLVVGGIIGWKKSGSRVSLTASLASAALLAVAHRMSRTAPLGGYVLAAVVALALTILFSNRLRKTKKFMPSGMMLLVSGIATLLLALVAASMK
jgi:uncharacterized membrane protein (UPF0136 family)